jgi:hypothetical protein
MDDLKGELKSLLNNPDPSIKATGDVGVSGLYLRLQALEDRCFKPTTVDNQLSLSKFRSEALELANIASEALQPRPGSEPIIACLEHLANFCKPDQSEPASKFNNN